MSFSFVPTPFGDPDHVGTSRVVCYLRSRLFIVDIQSELRPDHEQMSFAVQVVAGAASVGGGIIQWNGPDQAVVRVQAILYSSLCALFTVVFITIFMGLQWLNHYARPERGLSIDSIRNRKLRMDGMDSRCLSIIMDCLPLILQAPFVLLGSGLSYYLFFDRTAAGVVIGSTSLCLFLYIICSLAATFSRHCPYQTPLTFVLRRSVYRWLPENWRSSTQASKPRLSRPNAEGGDPLLPMWTLAADPDPLFKHRDTDWADYAVYSDCVAWMLGKPVEQDAFKTIVGFVPEIFWHAGIKFVPLQKMYEILLECFDERSVSPVVITRYRDQAYLGPKAVFHVLVQRKCFGGDSDAAVFKTITVKHRAFGP